MKLFVSLGTALLVLVYLSGLVSSARQEKSVALANCESNAATLDAAHQLAPGETLVIAIARLGDGETSCKLNGQRLQMVRKYLTETPWHKPAESVILAKGERTSGNGRVELYIGGKLFHTLPIERNRNLPVYGCAD